MVEDIKAVEEVGEEKEVKVVDQDFEKKKFDFFKKIGLKRRKENVVSEESAKLNFEAILYKYDIEFKDIVSDRGKEGAQTLQNKFVRWFMAGRIEINISSDPDKGFQIIQNLESGHTVAYNEYNAPAAEESDKARGQSGAQYMLLGSLCGKGADFIRNKKVFNGDDLKVAESIALLFFL